MNVDASNRIIPGGFLFRPKQNLFPTEGSDCQLRNSGDAGHVSVSVRCEEVGLYVYADLQYASLSIPMYHKETLNE